MWIRDHKANTMRSGPTGAGAAGGRGAIGNRSETVVLSTPRGPVEVVRQQRRAPGPRAKWEWEWIARRGGRKEWRQAARASEAIRQAALLPAGKHPAWLAAAASEAERQLGPADGTDVA